MENLEKCEWNEINRLKRPNRLKRTTFSSKPVFRIIFRLGRPKICVPFIFYPELPESMSMVNNHGVWHFAGTKKNAQWKETL